DAGGGRAEEPILALRHDGDHPSVGRRDDTVLARRRRALGIAKEIEAQGKADDERHDGRRVPGGGTYHGDEPEDARRHRDHRPAFARDRQDAAHLLNCASGRRGGWTRARASATGAASRRPRWGAARLPYAAPGNAATRSGAR